jgi:hypothetical protein
MYLASLGLRSDPNTPRDALLSEFGKLSNQLHSKLREIGRRQPAKASRAEREIEISRLREEIDHLKNAGAESFTQHLIPFRRDQIDGILSYMTRDIAGHVCDKGTGERDTSGSFKARYIADCGILSENKPFFGSVDAV